MRCPPPLSPHTLLGWAGPRIRAPVAGRDWESSCRLHTGVAHPWLCTWAASAGRLCSQRAQGCTAGPQTLLRALESHAHTHACIHAHDHAHACRWTPQVVPSLRRMDRRGAGTELDTEAECAQETTVTSCTRAGRLCTHACMHGRPQEPSVPPHPAVVGRSWRQWHFPRMPVAAPQVKGHYC